MQRGTWAWATAFALWGTLGTAGCGAGSGSAAQPGDVAADFAVDGPRGADFQVDFAGDGALPDGAGGPETAGPVEGEFGWPCTGAGDCHSGYCVVTADGRRCSRTCVDSCPDGFSCRQNVAAQPAVVFVCLPALPTFCAPCRANRDCLTENDQGGHRCLPHGDAGAFCGGDCGPSGASCPVGSFCSNVADIEGGVSRQCVPTEGECRCSPGASERGAATSCAVRNEFGACLGERRCTSTGLTACDAALPQEDVCDGLDNDCDGAPDDAFEAADCTATNAFGTCLGALVCTGAAGVACTAANPAAESCDSADNDCDDVIDEADAFGCTLLFADGDGDGFGVGAARCLCAPDALFRALQPGDCDDARAEIRPQGAERCNGRDDDCDGATDEEGAAGCAFYAADGDGDGFGNPADMRCLCAPAAPYVTTDATDCHDTDPTVGPAAGETCDGTDNDCDGATDEEGALGCALLFADGDGDGMGDPANFACLCAAAAPYVARTGGDCADTDPTTGPARPEVCDGRDNDCNGATDEGGAGGCVSFYLDGDGDGFGVAGDFRCLCAAAAPYTATEAGDCDDGHADAKPGGAEVCDGRDNDCDGVADAADAAGCAVYFRDHDLDGHGAPGESACLCAPAIPYLATTAEDCDDANPLIYPAAGEACNGLDDDCDGFTDQGVAGACTPFFADGDGDGFGAGDSVCLCGPEGDYTTSRAGDCADDDRRVYPLADELCNGRDDDCDGETDEEPALGCQWWFLDADRDNFGVLTEARCLCAPDAETGYDTMQPGDCDDAAAAVWPGAAEACNGGDDDCDGATDEPGATGCAFWLRDSDGDGFGVAADALCLCAPDALYRAAAGGDCDDGEAAARPDASESCDGLDNDCNGVVDDPDTPGCTPHYADADGDGYGGADAPQCLCAASGRFTALRSGDCDDALAFVNPGAPERCDGVDNDCDAQTDGPGSAGCVTLFADRDGDTFGVAADTRCLCAPDDVHRTSVGGDCDDADPAVSPAAGEACDTLDNDCDDAVDEPGAAGCVLYLRDADRDEYGVSGDARCLCTALAPYDRSVGGDCDDEAASVHPGVAESCNGVDDDCDGIRDNVDAAGCTAYLYDGDGDGWGVSGDTRCLCAPLGAYAARRGPDCNDTAPLQNPGATEACNDVDDDCDGATDEPGATGCVVYLRDHDGDGFGVAGTGQCLCAPAGERTATVGGDCDDASESVYPAAVEVCDAVDNDCNATVDEGCGLPGLGWPTHMLDLRRTGHTMNYEAPESPVLRWQRTLPGAPAIRNSPVLYANGDVVVAVGNRVFRLAATTGDMSAWPAYTLPGPVYAWAGPTLREGGTILVPAGNSLVLLRPDLTPIWSTDLGATLVSTPLVDPNGSLYVVSAVGLHRVGPDGGLVWTVAAQNNADTPSHPAMGINGEIFFTAADHKIYAVDPDAPAEGRLLWSVVPTGVPAAELTNPVDASVTVSELGYPYQVFGDSIYALNVSGNTLYTVDFNLPVRAGLGIHNTGFQCCNPEEFIWVSPTDVRPLRRYTVTLALVATTASAVNKHAAARSAPPVFDRNGDVLIGGNDGRLMAFTQGCANKWSFATGASPDDIDGPAAIGNGIVVFGDASGTVYCLQE